MAFAHNYGFQNVKSTLNTFLKNNISANLPSWITWSYGATPPRTVNFDVPEQPLNFPSFGVGHLGSDTLEQFQGDQVDPGYSGIHRQGMMEVNCWETSKGNFSWGQRLETMRDMVVLLFQRNRSIPLQDFTTPSSPSAINALVRIRSIRDASVAPDPDPAVKRKRILVSYSWTERWS